VIEVLAPLELALLIIVTITIALLVGHATTKMVLKAISRLFGIRVNVELDSAPERLFAYAFLGFAFIIVYGLVLSVFVFLNQFGVLLVIGFSIVLELLFLAKGKTREKVKISSYVKSIWRHVTGIKINGRHVFLLVLSVVAVVWYFSPAIQLASYPGGDDRTYLFITKQIIDKGTALIGVDYPYTYPVVAHVTMAGFMIIASFFFNLLQIIGLPTSIPVIHLFLTLLYFSLTPVSIYLLTMGLSKNKEFSIITALAALFMWRSILFYFNWGGIGEALGYLLVPLLAFLDYELNRTLLGEKFRLKAFIGILIIKLVMVGIVIYIHFYSAFLFVFLVIIVIPLLMTYCPGNARSSVRDKAKKYFVIISPYLLIFCGLIIFVVAAVMLLQFTGSTSSVIENLYYLMSSSQEQILNDPSQWTFTVGWLILRSGMGLDYAVLALGSIFSYFYGDWIFIFALLFVVSCAAYLLASKKGGRPFVIEVRKAVRLTSVMAIVALIFLLFTQDSPFGWFYIPYPYARSVYTVRLYYELNVFLIYIEALPMYLIYFFVKRRIAENHTMSKEAPSGGLPRGKKLHVSIRAIGAVTILALVVLPITLGPVVSDYYDYMTYRNTSVVTPSDLDAFDWIEANIPKNATFFVSSSDAGAYIYIYTGRIALPPEAFHLWSQVEQNSTDFGEIETALRDGNITQQLIQLLRKYNISYVYAGERTQYSVPGLNTTALIQSPYFEVSFNEGETYVFDIIY
jgi:hypothetical protein